jgi:hypothetical protein
MMAVVGYLLGSQELYAALVALALFDILARQSISGSRSKEEIRMAASHAILASISSIMQKN